MDFLQNLPQDMLISPVVVVGKYRSGKSYLINKCLLNQ